MSEVTKTFKYSQTGKKGSVGLLILVLTITIGFFVYDYFLKKEINSIKTEISQHKDRIEQLEAQDNIYIYSLIKRNKDVLDELDDRSRITKYIDHVQTMVQHYDFDMRGFQMGAGNISTKLTFKNNEIGLAYKKAARFIADYRTDESALLLLNEIPSMRSSDQGIKFPVLFSLKK